MKKQCERIFTLNEPNAPRINPALACEIGLNESIVLLQIEFWISISDNWQDGRKWTYQSVREMKNKSFPFWSIATINRAVNSLIDEGYLIDGNYNKKKYDKTRWFALNFSKLQQLDSISIKGYESEVFQNDTGVFQNDTRSNQNETTIPETTTETTTRITKNDNGILSSDKNSLNGFPNSEIVSAMKIYMNDLYIQKTGEKHPRLKPEQHKHVYDTLDSFCDENAVDEDGLVAMMIAFLNSEIDSDWNINHFATEGILMNRFYEELY